MAYEPKEWVCGETITADGLNNMEEGIQEALESGGGDHPVFVADVLATKNGDDWVCTSDASYSDLVDAYDNGKLPIVRITINPNDGRPSQYYTRETMLMQEYVGSSTMRFATTDYSNASRDVLSFSYQGNITFTRTNIA